MFKELSIALMLGTCVPSFAADIQQIVQKLELNTEEEVSAFIAAGFGNMLLGRYAQALEDFDNAEAFLVKIEADVSEVVAVIQYAKIITYDCLNMRPECERALGRFILAASSDDLNTDDSDDSDAAITDDEKELEEFMKQLASLAPSQDIRKFLANMMDDSFSD